VLHLSYTAEEDQALRDHWDGTAQALLAVLADADPSHAPPLTRVFSMRSDFPEAFQRLLNSPIGTEIDITIGDSSLPVFLGGRKATMSSAAINLVTALDDVAGFDLGIGRKVAPPNEQTYNPVGPFAAPATTPPSGELRAYDADIVETPARPGISGLVTGTYALKCAAGGPFEKAGAAGTPSTLDGKTLRDILLTVGYHVGTA
jgi:hypothetical protein